MACELQEAITHILKYAGTRKNLQNILDNDKVISKSFGKLIKDNYGEEASTLSLQEFGKGLSTLIRKVTGVTVSNNKEYALEQIKLGMDRFSPARYSIAKGIEVADATTTDILTAISTDYVKNESMGNLNTEVDNALQLVAQVKGANYLQHELVHAGALEFMSLNPNEEATKRISDIYTYLYNNHDELGLKEGYWKTNVDEFLAEALSNAEVMQVLLKIKPTKPVSRISNIYEEILNTILGMLGYKDGDLSNMFEVVLDSNLKMLEDGILGEQQGTQKPKNSSKGTSTKETKEKPSESFKKQSISGTEDTSVIIPEVKATDLSVAKTTAKGLAIFGLKPTAETDKNIKCEG